MSGIMTIYAASPPPHQPCHCHSEQMWHGWLREGKTDLGDPRVGRQAFKEVVHSCLCKEPDHRPTATQLMQFRFFRVRL